MPPMSSQQPAWCVRHGTHTRTRTGCACTPTAADTIRYTTRMSPIVRPRPADVHARAAGVGRNAAHLLPAAGLVGETRHAYAYTYGLHLRTDRRRHDTIRDANAANPRMRIGRSSPSRYTHRHRSQTFPETETETETGGRMRSPPPIAIRYDTPSPRTVCVPIAVCIHRHPPRLADVPETENEL
jgi:hypothetical protein